MADESRRRPGQPGKCDEPYSLYGMTPEEAIQRAFGATPQWPFNDSPDCEAVSLKTIVSGDSPIVLVVHETEDDGGWQFLDGNEFSVDKAVLVSLSTIAKTDPSILALGDLPEGWQATRASTDETWERRPILRISE